MCIQTYIHKYTHTNVHVCTQTPTHCRTPTHTLLSISNGQHHPVPILGVHISEFKLFPNTSLLYVFWQVPASWMCLSIICNL